MTILEAMRARHAVRSYKDKKIEESVIKELQAEINRCNQKGNLSIQLIRNDTNVFKGLMANFVGFRGVSNYIALVGESNENSEEKAGYYGQRIALTAQQLGLNTCWAASTYKNQKCKASIGKNEKLVCVMAIGYGATQGIPHKSKTIAQLCRVENDMPDWFRNGMIAVALAPTAQNKQDFLIVLNGEKVQFEVKESKYSKIDLGIIKYHFETGAGLSL
ncbi:nitroreductase family protein [uncultured Robinsoniella sp.]|uniref:nitroreductase family protein n=1 Tax=uncultured Robinsoniella sp. TaxID=904190 RepID=UPI00374E6C32